MYSTPFDTLLAKAIEDFYYEVVADNPLVTNTSQTEYHGFFQEQEALEATVDQFVKGLDLNAFRKQLKNQLDYQENLDILYRYVSYYLVLSIAYHYGGTSNEFRDSLVQISRSKDQKQIRFSAENVYTLVQMFQLIKQLKRYLDLSSRERTNQASQYQDAITFMGQLGKEAADILTEKVDPAQYYMVYFIVVVKMYHLTERPLVTKMAEEVELEQGESIVIEIVRLGERESLAETIQESLAAVKGGAQIANEIIELRKRGIAEASMGEPREIDQIMRLLVDWEVIPVVDDFLMYHQEQDAVGDLDSSEFASLARSYPSELVDQTGGDLPREDRGPAGRLAGLVSKDTVASAAVNKIDQIADYYFDTPDKADPFVGQLRYRRAVVRNYYNELRAYHKIVLSAGSQAKSHPFFAELEHGLNHAYHPFRSLGPYHGMHLTHSSTLRGMIRQCDIDYAHETPARILDTHSSAQGELVNLTGLAIAWNPNGRRLNKEDLLDIRSITFRYLKPGTKQIMKSSGTDGYRKFLIFAEQMLIASIRVRSSISRNSGEPQDRNRPFFFRDTKYLDRLNPDLVGKVIYWQFDPQFDHYRSTTVENIDAKDHQYGAMVASIATVLRERFYLHAIELLRTTRNKNPVFAIATIEHLMDYIGRKLTGDQRTALINQHYYFRRVCDYQPIPKLADPLPPITYRAPPKSTMVIEQIDMRNPVKLTSMVQVTLFDQKNYDLSKVFATCEHELAYSQISQLRRSPKDLNRYNALLGNFLTEYARANSRGQYICTNCGRVLPIEADVQEGFEKGSFVVSYIPDGLLEKVHEYEPYTPSIRVLDNLVKIMARILELNAYLGLAEDNLYQRSYLIKEVLDIVIEHNSRVLTDYPELDPMIQEYTKYGISPNLNSVHYFRARADIAVIDHHGGAAAEIRSTLIYTNLLLLLSLGTIMELSDQQIIEVFHDKVSNLKVYQKFGYRLFQGLMIRTNITDDTVAPISDYPVLCYLIFTIGHILQVYGIYPGFEEKRKDDARTQKMIIHTIVHLINALSEYTMRNPKVYIYQQFASKFYSHMNHTFKNNRLMLLMLAHQSSGRVKADQLAKEGFRVPEVPGLPIGTSYPPKLGTINRMRLHGLIYLLERSYDFTTYSDFTTDRTNCDNGAPIDWKIDNEKQKDKPDFQYAVIRSDRCPIPDPARSGKIDRLSDAYYYQANILAKKRCTVAPVHQDPDQTGTCELCKQVIDQERSREELDRIWSIWAKQSEDQAEQHLAIRTVNHELSEQQQENQQQAYRILSETSASKEALMGMLEKHLGSQAEFIVDDETVSLRDKIFTIDHRYRGQKMTPVVIYRASEGKVRLIRNHPFFETDVYTYKDNKRDVDVFYDRASLQLIGYQEENQEPTHLKSGNYLQVTESLEDMLGFLGCDRTVQESEPSYLFDVSEILSWKQIIDWTSTTIQSMRFRSKAGRELRKKYPSITIPEMNSIFPDWQVMRNSLGRPLSDQLGKEMRDNLAQYYYHALQTIVEQSTAREKKIVSKLVTDLIISASMLDKLKKLLDTPAMKIFVYEMKTRSYAKETAKLSDENDIGTDATLQEQIDDLEDNHSMEMPDDIYDDE